MDEFNKKRMMKRNGHSVFEVVQQVIRNFFNEDDEGEREEFQRFIREPGLLNNAPELESKDRLASWLVEPSRFSSRDAYRKFQTCVKRGRMVRLSRNIRFAASFLLLLTLSGATYWWMNAWKPGNDVRLAGGVESAMPGVYIILDDGTRVDLGKDEGEIRQTNGIKITRDSTKVVYVATDAPTVNQVSYNELNVPRGGEYVLVLADGTKVWVNADTRLKYPVNFQSENREVFLISGEAYFEVVRDEEKPFVVHTSRGNVKVLGTEFNVRNYPDEYRVVTTLVNGSVQFNDKDEGGKSVVLKPGFQVVVGSLTEEWKLRKVNLEEHVGWREGRYVFNHLTLEELMKVVERNYDVTVFFANEECKHLVFSGDLRKYEMVERFLNFVETGGDVRFVVKDRTITVYKK